MIQKYVDIVGEKRIENIQKRCEALQDKKIVLVNSTSTGGGVAQMLKSITPFLRELGLNITWHVIQPQKEFFEYTKKIHNGLQGQNITITNSEKKMYEANLKVALQDLPDADFYFIHDPQPAGLIHLKDMNAALRIHIDISTPDETALNFLKEQVDGYKELIITHPSFLQKSLSLQHRIIEPAIDPFTDINRSLTKKENKRLAQKIPSQRYIAQVSRFDLWKDPVGVIAMFEKLHKHDENIDLVLLGGDADDDPEGQKIYEKVIQRKKESPLASQIHVIKENNAALVNHVQRNAEVIIQKSTREGFGLTVSEALYKETPVVASNVGGIPRQIKPGITGYLADPKDYGDFAQKISKLLENEETAQKVSRIGKQYVQKNFLLPRLAEDYLSLFEDHLS